MFHGVEAAQLSPPCWHVLDVSLFSRELAYVKRHFNVLPLQEALEGLVAGTLPDYAVALTFDDGTRNIARNAAPVLRQLELPAAIFLTTGPMGTNQALWPDRLWLAFARNNAAEVDLTSLGLGKRSLSSPASRGKAYADSVDRLKEMPDDARLSSLESILTTLGSAATDDAGPFQLLTWDEALSIAKDGRFSLHPHSVTHPILSKCGDEKIEHEIAESCAALERETGCAPRIFAYPNGRPQDFDERAIAVLSRCGVRWALSTIEGFAHAHSDPLALPRLGIGGNLSFAAFRLLLSGAGSLRHLSRKTIANAVRERRLRIR
jgi:peptidoglycan/xylan/chitin deacetylase (PgdA/CDA1 family)